MAVIAEILKVKYKINSISCLNRKGKTAQKKLNYTGRMNNLVGKIRIDRKFGSASEKIVLIDDIFTTGATMEQCTKVLQNAGVKQVAALTLALD